jgi:hypothetical protein
LAEAAVARALFCAGRDFLVLRPPVGRVFPCSEVKAASDLPARMINPKAAKASLFIIHSFQNRDYNNGLRRRIVSPER